MQIEYIFCYTFVHLSYLYNVGVPIEKNAPSDTNSILNCVGQMSCRLNVIKPLSLPHTDFHNNIIISMLLFLF